ncbi:hypothetical protein [Glycomyces tarimensis]
MRRIVPIGKRQYSSTAGSRIVEGEFTDHGDSDGVTDNPGLLEETT